MKLRITDRILVFIAGLLLLACCAGIACQLFFGIDLVGLAGRAFSSESPQIRIALIVLAVILFLLGCYCVLVLFRHRKRKDRFVLQKNEGGELAISIKALENMVQKCLEQHEELSAEKLRLENRKDGLLIRITGNVAGGISIPLTVEALQKQIRQYVTACSGVEIKGIRVQIESSGEDAPDAPFAIAAPAARPLLRDAEEKQTPVHSENPAPVREETPASAPIPTSGMEEVPVAAAAEPVMEDDDDRPLHQRLFSPRQEQCIVPEPPEMTSSAAEVESVINVSEQNSDESAEAEAAEVEEEDTPEFLETAEDGTELLFAEADGETASEPESDETTDEFSVTDEFRDAETDEAPEADPNYLDSLKAFDAAITGDKMEGKDHE